MSETVKSMVYEQLDIVKFVLKKSANFILDVLEKHTALIY